MSQTGPPVVLSIAGYDPSSGAGVTADVKTAAAHGCFAVTCITAVTVQNTLGVLRVRAIEPEIVGETLFELAADFSIEAVRIGMVGSGEVAGEVAGFLEQVQPPHIVLDPIFRSSSGMPLVLDAEAVGTLDLRLLKLAEVVTPNAAEATFLSGMKVETLDQAREAGRRILNRGAQNVVVTGGHLPENTDLLVWTNGHSVREELFEGERIESNATHGTGCAFAMAIACNLARGSSIPVAVRAAKEYVRKAIDAAPGIGKGKGPMGHLWPMKGD
jgi:hydroxymethylpyrimidine/phosphomethylpyrimidine kinase